MYRGPWTVRRGATLTASLRCGEGMLLLGPKAGSRGHQGAHHGGGVRRPSAQARVGREQIRDRLSTLVDLDVLGV